MLNENKNIDQIFREKLVDYEKTPPMFLWTNIQGELNTHRKIHRIAILKTLGIAAAVALAFLAGWQMTNTDHKDTASISKITEQHTVIQDIEPSSNNKASGDDLLTVYSNPTGSNISGVTPRSNHKGSSKLSSFATFGANTTFLNIDNPSSVQNLKELELFNTEKDFLDKLHQNLKVVKKLTDWIATVGKDSLIKTNDSKAMITGPLNHSTDEGSARLAMNNPVRKSNGRWSLKAEFAPVFKSNALNGGQKTDLFPNGSKNYPSQETNTESTLSGGMMAGYKVGKRFHIKSGIVFNNLRQTTRNVGFMGRNSLYDVPGSATLASTPAGQVSLNRVGNTRSEAINNSSYLLANASTSTAANELKQDIKFIEIPVQATYNLIDNQFSVGLTGGISTNILVGNKAVLIENGEKISDGETANMRNVVYSGAVGFEIGYEITNRIKLTIEPRIKHFINSLSTNKSVNFKPGRIEIVTGLSYCFN